MKKLYFLPVVLIMLAGCAPQQTSTQTERSTETITDFSASAELAERQEAAADENGSAFEYRLNANMPKDKNYIFSPLGLKMSLDLAINGAEKETKKELLEVTGIKNIEEFNDYERHIVTTYVNNGDILLKIANSFWMDSDKMKNTALSPDYLYTVGELYNAKIGIVQSKTAAKTINTWCGENTNNRINDIITKDNFGSYLANALYFSGVWTKPFVYTQKSEFTDRNGKTSEIDFMNNTDFYNYYEDSEIKIVEIPFGLPHGKRNTKENSSPDAVDMAMYVVLNGDRRMELTPYLDILSGERVHISLPRFEVSCGRDFSSDLTQLGVKSAFDASKADFVPMFGDKKTKFCYENLMHKAVLKINEKGAEQPEPKNIPSEPEDYEDEKNAKEFIADSPFTFLIVDRRMNEVVFMGEYAYVNE